jgi:RNA polymerase sigma factor (TIGR02999 family)
MTNTLSGVLAKTRHVTTLLLAWSGGDRDALDQLVPLVHDELRRRARRVMVHERADHSLQPTALVNEVYLRLVDMRQVQWTDRAHFLALAARLMRRILVDLARSQLTQKRGAGAVSVSLDENSIMAPGRSRENLVALDDALQTLAALDPRRSQVVELRFFAGLDVDETAEVLKVSRRTVMRDWTLARTWLFRELRKSHGDLPRETI